MWLVVKYKPANLFSLRDSRSTSSGGKSLLLPTPYSVKLALIDVIWRLMGRDAAADLLRKLSPVKILLRGPEQLVLNNCFVKIARVPKDPKKFVKGSLDSRGRFPFDRTVSLRQYVYYQGDLDVAFSVEGDELLQDLKVLLPRVNYFGKRGSFFQFDGFNVTNSLDEGFNCYVDPSMDRIFKHYILQQMDDMNPQISLAALDITSDEKITVGKDRIFPLSLLPYQLKKSSKQYAYFVRSE